MITSRGRLNIDRVNNCFADLDNILATQKGITKFTLYPIWSKMGRVRSSFGGKWAKKIEDC